MLLLACALAASRAAADPFPERPVKIVIPYPISGPTDIRGNDPHHQDLQADRAARAAVHLRHAGAPRRAGDRGRLAPSGGARTPARRTHHPRREGGGARRRRTATRCSSRATRPWSSTRTISTASSTSPSAISCSSRRSPRCLSCCCVGSSVPAATPRRLGEWLKVRPGEINYGSSGDGSVGHLAGELFRRATGVNIVHVSYNGGIAALSGLATGPGLDHVRGTAAGAAVRVGRAVHRARHRERAGASRFCLRCPRSSKAACPTSKWRRGSACSDRRACRLPPLPG